MRSHGWPQVSSPDAGCVCRPVRRRPGRGRQATRAAKPDTAGRTNEMPISSPRSRRIPRASTPTDRIGLEPARSSDGSSAGVRAWTRFDAWWRRAWHRRQLGHRTLNGDCGSRPPPIDGEARDRPGYACRDQRHHSFCGFTGQIQLRPGPEASGTTPWLQLASGRVLLCTGQQWGRTRTSADRSHRTDLR
jgi:hypothetical protein